MSLSEEQKTFFTNDFSNFWPFIEKIDVDRESDFYDLEKQCRQYGV